MAKSLIVIAGPTAAGKTARAIEVARSLQTEIISCDSRQCYRELNIGVARPSADELAAVPHHFIACRSVCQPYNVYEFEHDALSLLDDLFAAHDSVVAVGGSGLYIEALCNGIARLPDPAPGLREKLKADYAANGIEAFRNRLLALDPAYYSQVDLNNRARLQRALEVCLTAGRPYSVLLSEQQRVSRPFEISVEVVMRDPHELRRRIDARVDGMVDAGLCDEVRALWPLRHLNTLNTVGYREFFAYGSMEEACANMDAVVAQIKLDTWHYAKKQMTWCKKKYR